MKRRVALSKKRLWAVRTAHKVTAVSKLGNQLVNRASAESREPTETGYVQALQNLMGMVKARLTER